MHMRCLSILVTFFFLLLTLSEARAEASDRLLVSETPDAYLLSVPVSHLQLVVPKGNLVQVPVKIGGSTNNPRYFHFTDNTRGLIISGWFEPATRYRGINGFWEQEMSNWKNTKLPTPTDVSIEKVGSWDVIFYQQPMEVGSSSHIRAHFVQAGTWIDIHISATTQNSSATNRPTAEALLKSLVVRETPHG